MAVHRTIAKHVANVKRYKKLGKDGSLSAFLDGMHAPEETHWLVRFKSVFDTCVQLERAVKNELLCYISGEAFSTFIADPISCIHETVRYLFYLIAVIIGIKPAQLSSYSFIITKHTRIYV